MTITYSELKKQQAKFKREEKARLEAILHPCPTINGIDILHEHRGQMIVFSAWNGDNPVQPLGNRRYGEYSRQYILNCGDFYKVHADDLKWLTESD
jgi:hypothetical protein